MSRQYEVRYRWALDDYVVLSKRYATLTRARRASRVIHAIVDVALFAAAVYFWWIGERVLAGYFLALVVFLLLLVFIVAPWRRRRSFAHQRLGEFDIDFHADEDGFVARSELGEARNKWAMVRHVDDLPRHVLLWPNNRMGWMVPKRAFATPEEAAAFVALAKEKTDGQTL